MQQCQFRDCRPNGEASDTATPAVANRPPASTTTGRPSRPALVISSIRKLARDEAAQLYELSEVLEGLAARLAADRIALPGHRQRINSAVDGLRAAAAGDVRGLVAASAEFHRAIVDLSGHARLAELVDQVHIQTFTVQLRHAGHQGLAGMQDGSVSEHLELANAILSGDGATAEASMRSHLGNAKERFLRLPDDEFA